MTALLGPADAGNYRVQHGRYQERWYTDPLPECSLAQESDWRGPSVSTTKPPFANKYVPMRSIAEMASHEWARLAGVDAETRYEAVKAHDKLAGRLNMQRGSIVHEWAEDRLLERTLQRPARWDVRAVEQAERFRPALDAFFDTHQPELVAAETVCLHRTLNGVGYGGTTDAIVNIGGDLWDIDWKSRNSAHAAHLEEAAQGGGYIGAEYMIVTGPDGTPMRAAIPKVAGVLIVSIRDDGFRAYPIEAAGAITAYHEMHRWWVAQRRVVDDDVIGRPWAPKTTSTAPAPVPAYTAPPTLPTDPDEGGDADPAAFDVLEQRYKALEQTARSWVARIAHEAQGAAVPFTANHNRTRRRYEIYRGLILLAEHGHTDPELVREIAATIHGDNRAFHPSITVGHAVGALNAAQAGTFARYCDLLCTDITSVDLRQRPDAA